MTEIKIDYAGHDKVYKQRKEKNENGWDNSENGTNIFLNQIDECFDKVNIPKNSKGLDLGCGNGPVSFHLSKKGYQMTGVDISETAINWAKELAETEKIDIDFVCENVVTSDVFQENLFDFIVDSHFMHCIIGDDRKETLNKINSILKPNGYFFIFTMCQPVPKDIEPNMNFDNNCFMVKNLAARFIAKPEYLRNELIDAGFELIYEEILSDDGTDYIAVVKKGEEFK